METLNLKHFQKNLIKKKHEKRRFLYSLAAKVVDKHVLYQDLVDKLLRKVKEIAADAESKTKDGKFVCRFKGCQKSFKFDGKRRHDHEASHEVSGALCIVKKKAEQQQDDLYNYQISLPDLGMNILNFYDR